MAPTTASASATASATEELVYTETKDGHQLEGAIIRPSAGSEHSIGVVWIHGTGIRFYFPPFVHIGRALAQQGVTFVTGNTRGHDIGTAVRAAGGPTAGGPTLGGAGWERFEDSPHDLAAWIDFVAARGVRRIMLVGHSYGGAKAVYYQAQRQDPRVAAVVVASSGTVAVAAPLDPVLVAQAERMVLEGRGTDLLPWGAVPGGAYLMPTVSAQTYLSRAHTYPELYGDGTHEPALSQIRCALFACYGTNDTPEAPARLDVIRQQATRATRVETCLIAGADHGYGGYEAAVAATIMSWIVSLS